LGKGHKIRERYEATAKGYDELYRAEQYEKYSVTLRRVPPKGKILDAGCGTGLLAEYMRSTGYLDSVDEYWCLDYSWEMLRIARWRLACICPDKCYVIEGNVMALPFRDNQFDIVYSFTVLDLVDDLHKAVGELVRVSKGAVVASLLKKLPHKDKLLAELTPIIAVTSKDVIFRLA
jgi:ubiquinone/menaquinone biosynthesis C-methylase UbiE